MKYSKSEIITIPIKNIKIVNPRSRNIKVHKKIKDHINNSGLRRPIIVREIKNNLPEKTYALICGQGRLESLMELGEVNVPALIADVDAETGYIMSLVENIARRSPRSIESLERIRDLKEIGLSDKKIADRIGYPETWVNNIIYLLDKGEKRLLIGVESGTLPLYLAVEISRSDDSQIQNILLEAYENNDLRGKQIGVVRKILDSRSRIGKKISNAPYGTTRNMHKKDIESVIKIYEQSVNEKNEILTKSRLVQESLSLSKQIIKNLIDNAEFVNLLESENLNSIPKIILDDKKES
ncbi:ParB/RepB/Spo0J family partition protein [Morganella morganii]|uniref:ParB/RepB/Spo0J family partition protein n=1 Tax=Morganella morganii TaxID=582 RepID=UPI001BDA129F|nr:plasmid partitioning protein RepB C-terminal domain-containing protein [Morganella morganii]MBT0318527.1 ParB N-terminal domain-containing protein [Morganella morganii subsp. morganii]